MQSPVLSNGMDWTMRNAALRSTNTTEEFVPKLTILAPQIVFFVITKFWVKNFFREQVIDYCRHIVRSCSSLYELCM
ncbi:unnamed protein product [Gongylonema pulchrum]|uniref:Bestrophin homolog n=1 Tax=Gongylonema pulchrum TaxID=637853 RepID=A0A183E556_9BILA|nr:unnamed protein product [Gongylonema pulchrum]